MLKNVVLTALIVLFACSCTVDVAFRQDIELSFSSVQTQTATNVSTVVSESSLTAGLDTTGYALGDFDSLVLHEARVESVTPVDAWDRVNDFIITFRGDNQNLNVFLYGDTVPGDGRNLSLHDDDMLTLIRGGSFIVDAQAVLAGPSPQITFRIVIRGVLSTTVP